MQRATEPPSQKNSDPAGISALMISSRPAIRSTGYLWLPGTTSVVPLSARKSEIARIEARIMFGHGSLSSFLSCRSLEN
ncbi:MAG: hypothetical protein QNL15_14335 [Pseudomonadales bacterium]